MLARISKQSGVARSQLPNGGVALTNYPVRNYNDYNKMAIPIKKLKFVKHPRYGPVYPVVCMDNSYEWPTAARLSTTLLTAFNGLTLYSTFYMPIFTAEFSALVANPMVLLPSLLVNFFLYKRNYALLYMDRSLVTNIFLMPCGRKFICETRDKQSSEVTIADLFMVKHYEDRFDTRVEFQHGANVYKQIRGTANILDNWVLATLLDNKNIDTKNQQYDFDFTKEFTWDFRDLVEIKKRKRFVTRTYKPTLKVLSQVRSADAFEKARKNGTLATKRQVFEGYDIYKFFEETQADDKDAAAKAVAQHALNVTNAGKPFKAKKEESQGRRVKQRPVFSLA